MAGRLVGGRLSGAHGVRRRQGRGNRGRRARLAGPGQPRRTPRRPARPRTGSRPGPASPPGAAPGAAAGGASRPARSAPRACTRARSRPRAPCRMGSSTSFQLTAASTTLTATWTMARSPVAPRGRRGGQHDHRVMPQVDAVRADAHPAQRPPSQGPPEPAARAHGRRDHDGGGHRQQHQPAPVEERRVLAGPPHQHGDQQQPARPGGVQQVPPGRESGGAPAGPQHGQRRPDEQRERAGVGAVVDPGGVVAGVVQQRHLGGRRGGQHQRGQRQRPEPADPAALPPPEPQAEPQQARPDQVELLLDRQGPQMAQRRRRAELGEVRGVLRDQPPVADVAERGGHGPAQGMQLAPVQRGPAGDGRQHHEQGGQQPPCPAQPEVAHLDLAGGLPVPEQEIGDQVAAQGEEHPDAQQPARRPAEVDVERDHREHGQRPQTVQAGQVALAVPDRLRHASTPEQEPELTEVTGPTTAPGLPRPGAKSLVTGADTRRSAQSDHSR